MIRRAGPDFLPDCKYLNICYLCTNPNQKKMKKAIALLSTLALCALLFSSCIHEDGPNLEDVVEVGDLLPNFSVVMSDGSTVTGAELRKSPSVVVFFYSGCPDCRQALPSVQRLYNNYIAQGVRFALISREEGASTIEDYWQTNGFTMPYSAQEDRTIYELFAKSRVPRVYISDNGGRVRAIFTDDPVPTYEELVVALDALL